MQSSAVKLQRWTRMHQSLIHVSKTFYKKNLFYQFRMGLSSLFFVRDPRLLIKMLLTMMGSHFLLRFYYQHINIKFILIMASPKNFYKTILVLVAIVLMGECKTMQKKILTKQFNKIPQTIFLTQLDTTHSDTSITLKFKLAGEKSLNLNYLKIGLLKSENYLSHKEAPNCEEKRKFYSQIFDLKFFDEVQGMLTIKIEKMEKKSPLSYLYLFECDFIQQVENVGLLTLDIMRPAHKISISDSYSFWPYAIITIFCFAAILINFVKIVRHLKTYPNIESFVILFGFLLYSVAIACHFFSVMNKVNEGEQIELLEYLYETISTILNIGISIFFATITWSFLIKETVSQLEFVILFSSVVIINILSAFFSMKNRDPISNQHLYQGFMGYVVLLMDISNVVMLVLGSFKVGVRALNKDKKFIETFIDTGCIFLMANVLSYFLAKYLTEEYWYFESIPLFENLIRLSILGYLGYLTIHPEIPSFHDKRFENAKIDEAEVVVLSKKPEASSSNLI